VRYASASLLLRAVLTLTMAAAAGCDRDSGGRGVPAASDWKPPEPKASQVERGTGGARDLAAGAGPGDPHAGMGMEGDPHAGLDMGGGTGREGDPHAGMTGDMDPHAGLDMGEGEEDPAMAGMQPPDPDRPIDASKFLRGTIRAGKDVESAVRVGAVLFLSAWPVDPNTGEMLGSPVAVAKLDVGKLPMRFELSERDVMVQGTRFEGEVLITARVDADGEARSREPGDVEGRVRARIPATGIDLILDTALR
jgi:hypothetical protein